MYSLREKALIGSKWITSFLRSKWQLSDYPVRTRCTQNAGDSAWLAQILNWPGPAGVGLTQEEALAKLEENFRGIQIHRNAIREKMPRPGSHVPIQFASTERVAADPALHDDFVIRILGFARGSPVFISDQSSLDDFGDEAYRVELQRRILDVYGVDVSDLQDGLLCDIIERIQKEAI